VKPKHKILVEGQWYEVTEKLGFVHRQDGAGQAAYVHTPEGERVAVCQGAHWIFAKPVIHPRLPVTGQ
jgi:hypothetical protein